MTARPLLRSRPILVASCMGLAACGGGGGGGGDDLGGIVESEFADSTADTFGNKITNGGVTGSAAIIDVSSASGGTERVKIQLSNDLTTATVRIGGRQVTLTALPGAPLSPELGLYANTGGTEAINFLGEDYLGVIYYTYSLSGNFGLGVIGAETRAENLPSNTASFDGLYQFVSDGAAGGTGFVDINVNFGDGGVDGVFRDGLNATDVFGNLTGTISGNGFDGSLALDDAALAGNIDINGTFYGPTGEQLGGTMSGTVSATAGGDVIIAGVFTSDRN